MAVVLDLADIQGNILSPYGKQGYPKGRCILLHIGGADEAARAANGRGLIDALLPRVTSALHWDDKPHKSGEFVVPRPAVTLNIAFTFRGLVALGLPTRTLRAMPDPFIDGMAARARILGDDFAGGNWRESWDEVWRSSSAGFTGDDNAPHVLVTLNTAAADALEDVTREIEAAAEANGVTVVEGHNRRGQPKARYQDMSALFKPDGTPSSREHFGLRDGISDPVFEGQYLRGEEQLEARGNGAVDGGGNWRPLATGEFLLGYPDEAQETPGAAMPLTFSRNGTFIAYRKLHENVKSWNDFIEKTAVEFGKVFQISDPEDARAMLVAKMVGRWPDGVPLSKAPTLDQWKQQRDEIGKLSPPERKKALTDFTYGDDPAGRTCPLTSHIRRTNTRDSLDPRALDKDPAMHGGSVLNNRRRILRRGLPYGKSGPDTKDEDDHGIVMLVVCADLFRQFEFVQQQWINYGLDARSGGDACPIVGNHSQGADTEDAEARRRNGPKAKFVIPAPEGSDHPPFIVEGIPQFVETRGGDYFFAPSLTALRMIGMGTVDPT